MNASYIFGGLLNYNQFDCNYWFNYLCTLGTDQWYQYKFCIIYRKNWHKMAMYLFVIFCLPLVTPSFKLWRDYKYFLNQIFFIFVDAYILLHFLHVLIESRINNNKHTRNDLCIFWIMATRCTICRRNGFIHGIYKGTHDVFSFVWAFS